MATVFTITAPSSSIALDDKGHGAIAFTVANASGKPLRGRVKLVPQDPSQLGWLTLACEPELDFAAGGTQQFPVQLAAPAGSKPGNYTFRLDAFSVQNPDEDYAQGATVAFTVREAKKPKPFPWWIVAVAAVVLIGGGITAWLLLRGVTVPDLTGMTQDAATTALTSDNLKLAATNTTVTDSTKVGKVVSQSPAAGQSVKSGSTVNVQIGIARLRVPILVPGRPEPTVRR